MVNIVGNTLHLDNLADVNMLEHAYRLRYLAGVNRLEHAYCLCEPRVSGTVRDTLQTQVMSFWHGADFSHEVSMRKAVLSKK